MKFDEKYANSMSIHDDHKQEHVETKASALKAANINNIIKLSGHEKYQRIDSKSVKNDKNQLDIS